MLNRTSTVRLAATLLGMAATTAFAVQTFAQSKQVVVRNDGSGAPPQVMQFSMPNFFDLRQPDFLKRDVPTFADKLLLSPEQTSVVQTMVEQYLESFKKLAREHLPKGEAPMRIALGGDMKGLKDLQKAVADAKGAQAQSDGKDDKSPAVVMLGPGDDPSELGDFDFEGAPELADFEQGGAGHKMAVGMTVRVGGPAEEGDDEQADAAPTGVVPLAEPGVSIAINSPDGEEIPEAMRQKLEEAAAKIAQQMKERMEKQAAEGGDAGGPLGLGNGPINIEDLQKRQEELAAQAESFRKAKNTLRQQFVMDVQTKLAEPQVERWPDLERTLRREKSLPKGRLSGERTDLVKVIKQLDLNEKDRNAVAESLHSYELALDTAIAQRNEFIPACETKVDKAMKDGETDKALSIIDRAASLRVAIRSINEQFTDVISEKLPADKAGAFRNLVLQTSYPSVYRTTNAQKTFAAARKIEGLDSQTLAGLAELEKAYSAELNEVNTQIRNALAKQEPLEPRASIEQLNALKAGDHPMEPMMMGDSNSANPVREAFGKRRDLDDRYIKTVRGMLSPDQVAQLPKVPAKGTAGQPIIIKHAISPQ